MTQASQAAAQIVASAGQQAAGVQQIHQAMTSIDAAAPQNLAAIHRHCHDAVHRRKGVKPEGSVHDKDDSAEEPYECESLTYGSEDQPGG